MTRRAGGAGPGRNCSCYPRSAAAVKSCARSQRRRRRSAPAAGPVAEHGERIDRSGGIVAGARQGFGQGAAALDQTDGAVRSPGCWSISSRVRRQNRARPRRRERRRGGSAA